MRAVERRKRVRGLLWEEQAASGGAGARGLDGSCLMQCWCGGAFLSAHRGSPSALAWRVSCCAAEAFTRPAGPFHTVRELRSIASVTL